MASKMNYIRAISRAMMPGALKLGLNTVSFEKLLRAQLPTFYRRTVFLADWREFAGIERKRSALQSVPKKYRPTARTMQEAAYNQVSKYHYVFKIEGWDEIEGKDIETYFTVATDKVLTMEQAEEIADRYREEYAAEIIVRRTSIDAVTRRREWQF